MIARTLDKPMQLQQWCDEHTVGDQMLWKGAWGHQVTFVRNVLAEVFGVGLDFDQMRQLVTVISTHTSKSIELPVYQLTRPDADLRVVLRNNFGDWKMSVMSVTPVTADFTDLFHTTPPIDPDYTGDDLHPVYFEGFPDNLIFRYLAETDGRKWSASIRTDEVLWTTIYLLTRSLGLVCPLQFRTKETTNQSWMWRNSNANGQSHHKHGRKLFGSEGSPVTPNEA